MDPSGDHHTKMGLPTVVLLLIVEILLPKVQMQSIPPNPNPTVVDKYLEYETISENEELFISFDGTQEYLFIDSSTPRASAREICRRVYRGHLAIVRTDQIAHFLAEALSETNLPMDSFWVGGIKSNGTWYWEMTKTEREAVNETIITNWFVKYEDSETLECLAITRNTHDQPVLPQFNCSRQRPFICERSAGQYETGTTHESWIRLSDNSLYKIFVSHVTWQEARIRCIKYDASASLAVVRSMEDAQALGRFLLIGRPRIENAWIGARWFMFAYKFEGGGKFLPNETDKKNGFPPWRYNRIQKTPGCVLLDVHTSNVTFATVSCQRRRSYICHKKAKPSVGDFKNHPAVNGTADYRVYFLNLSWPEAQKTCASEYNGKLAEFVDQNDEWDLVKMALSEIVEVKNVWLGGYFNSTARKWFFSNLQPIYTERFLKNISYYENIEKFNICLNMETEVIEYSWVLYGTLCTYPQNFICMYEKGSLSREEKEAPVTSLY